MEIIILNESNTMTEEEFDAKVAELGLEEEANEDFDLDFLFGEREEEAEEATDQEKLIALFLEIIEEKKAEIKVVSEKKYKNTKNGITYEGGGLEKMDRSYTYTQLNNIRKRKGIRTLQQEIEDLQMYISEMDEKSYAALMESSCIQKLIAGRI